MFNLVKNELIKIFHKKTFYIVLAIFLILSIIGVILTEVIENSILEYNYIDEAINVQEQYLTTIDKFTEEGLYTYSYTEAEIEYLKLLQKYGEDSWQSIIVEEQLYDIIIELSFHRNGVYKDKEEEKVELKNKYDEIIKRLDAGDWKAFVQEEIETTNELIKLNEESAKNTSDLNVKKTFEKEEELFKLKKQILEWRINKDICYGNKEMDLLLNEYEWSQSNIIYLNYNYDVNEQNYKDIETEDYKYLEKKEYQSNLAGANIAKYKIENSIYEEKSVTYYLQHLFESNGLMFTIIIATIFAGTIVNEEFNKGTIKLLLVRPYSRRKILLAKLISCFIVVIMAITIITVMQIVVLGVAYGFDTMSTPAILYDYNANSVMTMNILKYLAIYLLNIAPMIIIYIMLSFFIGSALKNSSLAIAVSLLLYMASSITVGLSEQLITVKWLKYIPIFNWDLNQYLYGKLPLLEGMNISGSIMICVDIILVLMIITFYNFEQRDVKNI